MTSRNLIAALTALALLVTSCTGGTGTDDTAATEAPSPAAEEIVLDDFSAAAVDPAEVIAAVERLRNVPHRSRSFIDFPASGQADELDSDKPVSMYEFDGTWASNTMLLGPGQSSGDPVGFVVSDRSTAYFYIPGAGDAQLPVQASDNPMVDAYDSWIVIDVEQVRAAVPPDLPFRIQGSALDELDEMIETLRGAETAVAGPRSSSRGVETRTYEMVVEEEAELELFSSTSVVTIHLDAEDRVREITAVNDRFGGSRIEFFDFDSEIAIDIPTDALDRTAAFVEQFTPRSVPSPAPPGPTPTPVRPFDGPTVLELLDAQPELSMFRELIAEGQNVELMLDLPNPEPWTIFAPTNDALAALGPMLDELRNDPLRARTFVLEHLVKGSYSLDDLAELDGLQLFDGWILRIEPRNGTIAVGSFRDTQPILVGDLIAGDGVVHVIAHTFNS